VYFCFFGGLFGFGVFLIFFLHAGIQNDQNDNLMFLLEAYACSFCLSSDKTEV